MGLFSSQIPSTLSMDGECRYLTAYSPIMADYIALNQYQVNRPKNEGASNDPKCPHPTMGDQRIHGKVPVLLVFQAGKRSSVDRCSITYLIS